MKGSMVGSRRNGALAWNVYGMLMCKMYGVNENDIMYHTVQWRIQDSLGGGGCQPQREALIYYYRPQRSWGKVIFSVACVKNSVHTEEGVPGQVHPPPGQVPTWAHTPPPGMYPPPPMVNERAVRILLECILIWHNFCRKLHENEKGDWEGGPRPLRPLDPPMDYECSP